MRKEKKILIVILVLLALIGIGSIDEGVSSNNDANRTKVVQEDGQEINNEDLSWTKNIEEDKNQDEQKDKNDKIVSNNTYDSETKKDKPEEQKKDIVDKKQDKDIYTYNGKDYTIISVDGGDRSGSRQANVAVDIGFGERVYWALTNDYGQLVYVIADKIVLQDDETEPVNKNGRYYDDEAYVPGVKSPNLDQGHVIADSLGGVGNAYNITPQEKTLNRHGNQAFMEREILSMGGCTDFVATITYPDTKTQIPSKYHYEYVLNGDKVVDDFENIDPDKANESMIAAEKETSKKDEKKKDEEKEDTTTHDISKVDTNNNGKVTITEAKKAGYKMPIKKGHWLYPYMDDRDGDGLVGE